MRHVLAGLGVLLSIGVTLLDFTIITNKSVLTYALLFMLSSVFDVVSLAIKEGLVRSQPLNQARFNFKIALSQFVVACIMIPIILSIAKELDDEPDNPVKTS